MCWAQTHSAPQQRWASLGQGTLHRWDGPPRGEGGVRGRSAHLVLVSPEVTGPGLDMGARVNGPPRGQRPSAAGVLLPGAEPPAPCPVLGQRPRPLLPHRIKRKLGGGGKGRGEGVSQPAASWGLCPDSQPRTEATATGSGLGHVPPGPQTHLPQPHSALHEEDRTAEHDPVLRPHGPARPASRCQAGCRPSGGS